MTTTLRPHCSLLFCRFRQFVFRKSRGPVRYALTAVAIMWLAGAAISQGMEALFGYVEETDISDSMGKTAILVLVVAPFIENLVMIIIVEPLHRFGGKYRTYLAISASAFFAIATHSEFNVSHGIFAAVLFATMSFTYLDWKGLRWSVRYGLTVLQHVMANTIPFVLLVFERVH